MEWFLTSNSTVARVLRTIVQGILAVLISAIPEIVGLFNLDPVLQSAIVAVLMAILSPIMSEIGKHVEAVNAQKRLKALEHEDAEEVKSRGLNSKG